MPLVLDRVGLIDATPGVLLNGALVSTGSGERYACVGSAAAFPPTDCTLFPIHGWAISAEAVAHRGFQVVLGVASSVEVPVGTFAAVAVSYHSADGQPYELVLPQAGRVCLSQGEPGCARIFPRHWSTR